MESGESERKKCTRKNKNIKEVPDTGEENKGKIYFSYVDRIQKSILVLGDTVENLVEDVSD